MSIASIVGRGFGPDASIAFICVRGYSLGAPAPVPTELPGHGDYPRFKKSVRPVWDRRPDALVPPEASEPDAPATEPVIEAKKPDLKPGDYESLSRLLAPELPKAPAPQKVRKARAVEPELPVALATADLVEAEDAVAAAGIVETIARGHLVDQDTGLAAGEVEVDGAALLYDTDQATGRATNPLVIGRAEITEGPDTMTGTAAWDDDDIALALLLGDHDG